MYMKPVKEVIHDSMGATDVLCYTVYQHWMIRPIFT